MSYKQKQKNHKKGKENMSNSPMKNLLYPSTHGKKNKEM